MSPSAATSPTTDSAATPPAPRPSLWTIQPRAPGAEAVARELGVSPLLASVVMARGYNTVDLAREFLWPDPQAVPDPFRMLGMREAAARIHRAVQSRERILLYGDYDVDGTSSVVILKKTLDLLGADSAFHVPHRVRDGYGMHPEVMRDAAAQGTRLVVSVDTGIRAAAVVEYARELGMDVIVTDHHLPDEALPPALAILNPNQPGCPYPEKNLCGAGVAYKLMQAILREFGMPAAKRARLEESFLKLAAIATVADVVPLTGENRTIVKCGLSGLTDTPNPGMRALLHVAGFRPGIAPTAGEVAFRIAPRINAAGRMASARDVIEMFLTPDAAQAAAIAAQLQDLNAERQDTEAAILAEVLARCDETPVTDSRRGLVFAGSGWHKGVVGIVASRLVERFWRPVFVLARNDETGEAQGSGRSSGGFHLLEALESMAELFTRFGGHRQAAGLTLPLENLDEFERRFNEYACARIDPSELRPVYKIDAEVRIPELSEKMVRELGQMAPFGFGNPAPLLAISGAQAGAYSLMKERHLKLPILQDRRSLVVKGWGWGDRAHMFQPGARMDFAVTVEEDSSGGLQAILKDARRTAD